MAAELTDKRALHEDSGKSSNLPISAVVALTLMGLWGCLSIYSAKSLGGAPLHFAGRQLVWLLLALGAFLLAARVPFGIYKSFAPHLAIVCIGGLAGVLLFGSRINGMRGWFPLGFGMQVQPSEFAKAPFLLMLCLMAHASGKWRIVRMSALTAAFAGLTAIEPDFGGAVIFLIGFLVVSWLACGSVKAVLWALAALGIFGVLFVSAHGYAVERIAGFLNPDMDVLGNGWHVKQFQYTLAHGGMFGSSWGTALWSNAFLPLPHSDSVYASIVESSGLLGGLLVLSGFVALAFWFNIISKRAKEAAARDFMLAVGFVYAMQALIHISVNATMIPPTGITLPILSYGGSSLFSTMIAFGMAVSASKASGEEGMFSALPA